MSSTIRPLPVCAARLWTARILGALLILFLLFDGVTKVIRERHVVEAFMQLGIPLERAPLIGGVVLVCAFAYALPRTSILGAILITGLLGGAIATHLRAGSPMFETIIFPVIMGALAWVPLWLRDERVRALIRAPDAEPA